MADLPTPAAGADEVRRIADAVLARQEFAEAQPTLWQRFLRLVGDFFTRVVEAVGGDGRGSVIGTAVVVALALLAVVVVIRYTRTLRRDPHLDLAVGGDVGRSSGDWLREAGEHEQSGQWRQAVRCRYRALLAELAAAGLVEEVAGRTAGEYLAAVTADVPAAAPAFTEATRRFEAAWYGATPVHDDDVEQFRGAAARTLAEAGVTQRALAATHA